MLFIMCGQVLDLMARMLGFSDEDKKRIGVAQQGSGKGVVRGVLGLPGRLVGGILGGGSAESPANAASDNHVIFLSKDLLCDIYKNASCLISLFVLSVIVVFCPLFACCGALMHASNFTLDLV